MGNQKSLESLNQQHQRVDSLLTDIVSRLDTDLYLPHQDVVVQEEQLD